MDLDAEVKKFKLFMADMHALFPGGADGLKAAAVMARAGEPMGMLDDPKTDTLAVKVKLDSGEFAGVLDEVRSVLAMGQRLEQLLPELETAIATVKELAGQVTAIADAVTALQQAVPAPTEGAGADNPSDGNQPSAPAPGAEKAS